MLLYIRTESSIAPKDMQGQSDVEEDIDDTAEPPGITEAKIFEKKERAVIWREN